MYIIENVFLLINSCDVGAQLNYSIRETLTSAANKMNVI